MINEFALDLKVARKEAGLTQEDCGHLLGVDRTKLSMLENGKRSPTIKEICALSLIYGRSFENIFGGIYFDIRGEMHERLKTMPIPPNKWAHTFNRHETLEYLAGRLVEDSSPDYEP